MSHTHQQTVPFPVRRDMLDEALLRPGRLEVQIEIGLPDTAGRLQILKIHTNKMSEHSFMGKDVNLHHLSEVTPQTGRGVDAAQRGGMSWRMAIVVC
jgi:ATP-dependent 26S proteasome regulatory subunit